MQKSVNLVPVLLIILSYTKGWAAHLDTLQVFSASMKKSNQTIVSTPQSASSFHRVLRVYVWHGYRGNPQRMIWQDIPILIQQADDYEMLIVIPDRLH